MEVGGLGPLTEESHYQEDRCTDGPRGEGEPAEAERGADEASSADGSRISSNGAQPAESERVEDAGPEASRSTGSEDAQPTQAVRRADDTSPAAPSVTETDSQAARLSLNRDAAQLALDEGRRALEQGDLERAVGRLKASCRLCPIPEAAALLQSALRQLQSDSRYCPDCHRARPTCVCHSSSGGSRQGTVPPHQHSLSVVTAFGLAINWLMTFCDRVYTALKRFLEERGILKDYSGNLAVIIILIPLLAILRYGLIRDQSIIGWIFAPPAPLYHYSSNSSSNRYGGSSYQHNRFHSPGGGSGEDFTAGTSSSAFGSTGGGFNFTVVSSPILPSLLLTVGVNLFLWLMRRQQGEGPQQSGSL
jgi:hypothetical protein